jgi:hypothetical protein
MCATREKSASFDARVYAAYFFFFFLAACFLFFFFSNTRSRRFVRCTPVLDSEGRTGNYNRKSRKTNRLVATTKEMGGRYLIQGTWNKSGATLLI